MNKKILKTSFKMKEKQLNTHEKLFRLMTIRNTCKMKHMKLETPENAKLEN